MSELKIVKQLKSNTPYKYGRRNKKLYITVHETGNTRNGADAQMHANLQSNGNSRSSAWHWQVDDKQAIQSFTHDFQLWASGDGRGNGNLNSIHIEICVNRDGDFKKAVVNASLLVKHIMRIEGIPITRVVQHNHWSGKNCPSQIRSGRYGINWSGFISSVAGSKPTPVERPVKPTPVHTQYQGDSIIDYLNSLGIDSSFKHREKLAGQYGIRGYRGTASQNLTLLSKMRNGKAPNVGSGNPKVGQKVRIKSSAGKYSRSTHSIPDRYKNKSYTIQQVGKNDVLLKELYSWVKLKDVY